jgi:GTP cyclohydrolase II
MHQPSPTASTTARAAQPLATPVQPVSIVSVADLPSRFGDFRAVAITSGSDGKEHIAIVRGSVRGRSRVPVRVHSECLTGDVLGSLRCDCRDQLTAALEAIGRMEAGVVLYMRQEGRGIGLTNKIRAYALQDEGHDTVDANRLLGFGDDLRDYGIAAEMLGALGLRSILLMTNNPAKVEGLRAHGVRVSGRLPHIMPANQHNQRYLATKQKRAGHWLGVVEPAERLAPERNEATSLPAGAFVGAGGA